MRSSVYVRSVATTVHGRGRRPPAHAHQPREGAVPRTGFTKAAVVDYYVRIAPVIGPPPAAAGRSRWSAGPTASTAPSFFEKRCPPHAPEWVATGEAEPGLDRLRGRRPRHAGLGREPRRRSSCTPSSHGRRPGAPDVDGVRPRPGSAGRRARLRGGRARAARSARPSSGWSRVVKTSGGKGLHLDVPVHGATADETKEFARALGQILERARPERVTTVMRKDLRARQGVRRLEPERPPQDDVARVLAARRGRGRRSRPRSRGTRSRDALETGDPGRLEFEAADVLDARRRARRPLRRQPHARAAPPGRRPR